MRYIVKSDKRSRHRFLDFIRFEMFKVKTFVSNSPNPLHINRLDSAVNAFIEKNDIDVIDIKYDTAAVCLGKDIYYYPSAMLIYKTKE